MEWRKGRRGFRSGREGEEVFDVEGDERRRGEEGFDRGGRELFFELKKPNFLAFLFRLFFQKIK